MFNISKYLEPEEARLFKVIMAIALTLLLVIIWDIVGIKVEVTAFYIIQKAIFIFGPMLVFFIPRLNYKVKHTIIACLYYLYAYINSIYVDSSYFTAFIQFYLGCVFILRYNTLGFAISHAVGFILYFLVLIDQQSKLSMVEFDQMAKMMNGAVYPIFFITVMIYFYIRRKEADDQVKSEFFRQVGQNVGFILHEIKQPLKQLQFAQNDQTLTEVNELLETANILWPSGKSSNAVKVDLNIREVINGIISEFDSYTKFLNIEISVFEEDHFIRSNRAILRIIIKNIIKNALEEIAGNEGENYLKIKLHSDHSIVIKNNISKKVNINKVFDAGYSTKRHVANKGLGLYICKNLSDKIGTKLSAYSNKSEFVVKIKF